MKIYHSNELVLLFSDNKLKFPEEYKLVATIDTNDLDEAYSLSQNISNSWLMNNKVKSDLLVCRSTSYGDVIEKEDGTFWICEMVGWSLLLKTGDKIIWDSGFGFETGEFVGEGNSYNTYAVKLDSDISKREVSFPKNQISKFSEELEKLLKKIYK